MANLPAYDTQTEDNIQLLEKPDAPAFQDPGGIMVNLSRELQTESQRLLEELKSSVSKDSGTDMIKVEAVFQEMVKVLLKETYCWIDAISPDIAVVQTDSVINNLKQILRERLMMVARNFYPFFPGNGDLAGKVKSTDGLTKEYESAVQYAADVAYASLPSILMTMGYKYTTEQLDKYLEDITFIDGIDFVLDLLARWRYHMLNNATLNKLRDKNMILNSMKRDGAIYEYLRHKNEGSISDFDFDYMSYYIDDLEDEINELSIVPKDVTEIMARTANATWKMQLPKAFLENRLDRIQATAKDSSYDTFDLLLIRIVDKNMQDLIAQGKSIQEAEMIAIWIATMTVMKDIVELRKARKRHIEAEKDKKVQEMFAV
jgi:predicted transcriptional regulator